MTVGAVILAATPASALAEAAGRASVRRIAETAWAGGALPLVVVAADPEGTVAAALGGSEATLVPPAPVESGPVGQIVRGVRATLELVASTDAALVWPARLTWVDAETVTSLLQAHGLDPASCLRPTWDGTAGWPLLLPVRHLDAFAGLARDRMPDDLVADLAAAGVPLRELDLGDPGAVLDRDTPIDALPPYAGPPEPLAPPPDWGAAAADGPDDAPAAPIRTLDPDEPDA
ncbi:MAG: NTP transferase domain-containing protein [Chloroflexota bacterium]